MEIAVLEELEERVKEAAESLRTKSHECEELRAERDALRARLSEQTKESRKLAVDHHRMMRLEREVSRLRDGRDQARARIQEILVRLRA